MMNFVISLMPNLLSEHGFAEYKSPISLFEKQGNRVLLHGHLWGNPDAFKFNTIGCRIGPERHKFTTFRLAEPDIIVFEI